MPVYIQTENKIYRVQPLEVLNQGVVLQHDSGWYEVGDDNGRIVGNTKWKWFSTDEILDGPSIRRKMKRKGKFKKNSSFE